MKIIMMLVAIVCLFASNHSTINNSKQINQVGESCPVCGGGCYLRFDHMEGPNQKFIYKCTCCGRYFIIDKND